MSFDMQNPNFMMNFARTARASTGIHKEPQDPGQSISEVTTPGMDISLLTKRQREQYYENDMHQIGEVAAVSTVRGKKRTKISNIPMSVLRWMQLHVNHLPQ